MNRAETQPRVAVLGAREDETELLADLHQQGRSELIGLYDPDPQALGLPLAEIMGIPSGSDSSARERLSRADYVVLPRDRMSLRDDVEWCSGLRAQLVSLDEARQRWGRLGSTPEGSAAEPRTDEALEQMQEAGERLRSPQDLGAWLLDITMPAVGATGGSIQLLSVSGDELVLVAGRGLSEHTLHNARRSLGEAVSGLVAATREPQIVHGDRQPHVERDRSNIQSAISLPLELEDGSLIGVLNLSTSVHGQHFEQAHVRLLQSLAPRCAVLLQQAQDNLAHRDHDRADALLEHMQILDDEDRGLRSNLVEWARQVRDTAQATALQLLSCRSDGAWMPLAQVALTEDRTLTAPAADLADQILLDGRWERVSRTRSGLPRIDALEAGIDEALEDEDADAVQESLVFVPLSGTEPWGLLVLEFDTTQAAEHFMKIGEPFARDLGLVVETRLQQQLARDRVDKLAQLARALPQLLQALREDRLPLELLEQARDLVQAQQVSFRRVDMAHRRYSPPVTLGVAESDMDLWRKRDASITEATLKEPQTRTTTTIADIEDNNDTTTARVHAVVSVPIRKTEQLLGILNVYEKQPLAPWQDRTFDEFDTHMLESLGVLLSDVLPSLPQPKAVAAHQSSDDPTSP